MHCSGPELQLLVQLFRQRANPGTQLAGSVGHEHHRERWIRGSERQAKRISFWKKNADGET